jgi:hypothetical protein
VQNDELIFEYRESAFEPGELEAHDLYETPQHVTPVDWHREVTVFGHTRDASHTWDASHTRPRDGERAVDGTSERSNVKPPDGTGGRGV